VSPDALDGEVGRLASLVASKSAAAIASGKKVFYRQLELSLGDAYGLAGHTMACDFVSDDGREGVDAFLGRRAPHWKDRH
jgi:enoyl-CoA hydratase/carnithine racemase